MQNMRISGGISTIKTFAEKASDTMDLMTATGMSDDLHIRMVVDDDKGKRLAHLDCFRILGVAGVIWAHNADDDLTGNVVYGQNWGLQVLMVITGIGWSMSSKSCFRYAYRLAVFIGLGSGLNLAAWILVPYPESKTLRETAGSGPVNFFNVVYQMWFAVGVMVCVVVTAPMKWGLQGKKSEAWIAAGGYSVCAVAQVVVWLSGVWGDFVRKQLQKTGGDYYARYSDESGFYVSQFWCTLALISIAYALVLTCCGGDGKYIVHVLDSEASPRSRPKSIVERPPWCTQFFAWGLLLLIYIPSTFMYEPVGAYLHDIQMFILGIVVQRFSVYGQEELATFVSSYWPLVIIFPLGAMAMPQEPQRRIDMFPLENISGRARFNGIEALFVLAFVVCGTPANPIGKRTPVDIVSDTYNILPWLNRWALFAYMSHIVFLRILPEPYGVFSVYFTAIAFWTEDFLHRKSKKGKPLGEIGLSWACLLVPFGLVIMSYEPWRYTLCTWGGSFAFVALLWLKCFRKAFFNLYSRRDSPRGDHVALLGGNDPLNVDTMDRGV